MQHSRPTELDEVVLDFTRFPLTADPATLPAEHLQESFKRLVLLYGLGREICAEHDPDRLFVRTIEAMSALLSIERAFVAVVSPTGLLARATHGIELGRDDATWPVSHTMLRRVIDEGVSILSTDAVEDTEYGHWRSVDFHKIRSVMCCPLGTARKPEGLIYADNRLATAAFSRFDLEFLTALAHYGSLALHNAQTRRHITAERELAEARHEELRRGLAAQHDIVVDSPSMIELYGQIQKVARRDISVLLVGETGTGKEVFARAIHARSARSARPFYAVDLSALSETMAESELFGHEMGAFTDAKVRRLGLFELASGGTLFLDEVQNVPPNVQAKLLRVLESREFRRMGGNDVKQADVRIVCACNRDPEAAVADGALKQDLYFRLNRVTLRIPPLRDRPEDVEPLVRHFLRLCRSNKVLDEDALRCLRDYSWPGNVRELRNCIEALDVLVDGQRIRASDLSERYRRRPGVGRSSIFEPLPELVARIERDHIRQAIEESEGNYAKAIALLKISRAKFFERKKVYGL